MLRWLRRRYWNRQRALFEFWDGTRIRRIDPLTVTRALSAHPRFNWDTHPSLVDAGDHEALTVTLEALRETFGLTAFDGTSGLTESETVALLIEFVEFLRDLKKKPNPGAILLSVMAENFCRRTSEATMPPRSDVGSTSVAPTSEPLEQPSVS